MANPYRVALTVPAAITNGIAQSQSVVFLNTPLALTGSLASGGVANLTSVKCLARRVGITSVGNDSGLTWTVTGTDRYGNAQTETMAGAAAGGTAQTVNDYATVTSIIASAATASTVTAGTTSVASTEWRVVDFFQNAFNVGIHLTIGGTVTCTVEYTFDDPNSPLPGSLLPSSNHPPIAQSHVVLQSVTANATGNFTSPIVAARLTINSGTGTAAMTLVQATSIA